MSRTTDKQLINKDDIKSRWEEIYNSKLNLKRHGSGYISLCPFHSERTPSFNVFNGGSYTCFGCGKKGGDVIQFIMELEGKTFIEALTNIKDNFNIQKTSIVRVPRIKDDILYEFDSQPFTKEHHAYWNKYYLSEDFVTRKGDIFAVKNWAINKKKQIIGDCEIMFCYVYIDDKGRETGLRKFLRLGTCVEKKDKWRTNVPNTKLWYTYKYVGKEVSRHLFVAKSNKDALVNMMAGIPSVATQSENDSILSTNIPYLMEICPNLVLNFGSDPQGTTASINVSKEFGLPWFNVPKRYLGDGINDNAEYQAEFGPECFKQLLKEKGYL